MSKQAWRRITQKLNPHGSTTGDLRKCPECGNFVDRREDHAPGCSCHKTKLHRSTATGGSTDLQWCECLAARLSASGLQARVVQTGAHCWVERWM